MNRVLTFIRDDGKHIDVELRFYGPITFFKDPLPKGTSVTKNLHMRNKGIDLKFTDVSLKYATNDHKGDNHSYTLETILTDDTVESIKETEEYRLLMDENK